MISLALIFLMINSIAQPINRQALVQRHSVVVTKADSLSSLSIGNGKFAFTTDVTGLQSFPEAYAKGVSLGTQSEWGWDSFKDTVGYKFEETLKEYTLNGKKSTYAVQWSQPLRNRNASEWFRKNPHRLQLGNLGFDIYKADGSLAKISDIKNIKQVLNLWTGEISSHFTVENIPVDVTTVGHQEQDLVAVQVKSKLFEMGRLNCRVRFP